MESINQSIEIFVLTETFQNNLKSSCEKKFFDKFWKAHKKEILKLSDYLSKIINFDGDSLIDHICHQFIRIVEIFVGKKLGNSSFFAPHSVEQSENQVDDFLRELKKGIETRNWNHFYDSYELVFDKLLYLARRQNVVDILVKRNGKLYGYFDDARNGNHPLPVTQESFSLFSLAKKQFKRVPNCATVQNEDNYRFLPRDHQMPEKNNDFIIVEGIEIFEEQTKVAFSNHIDYSSEVEYSENSSEECNEIEIGEQEKVLELLEERELLDEDVHVENENIESVIVPIDKEKNTQNDEIDEEGECLREDDKELESEENGIDHETSEVIEQHSIEFFGDIDDEFEVELKQDLEKKLKIQNEFYENELKQIQLDRMRMKEEIDARISGEEIRRNKIREIIQTNSVVLFTRAQEIEECQRVIGVLEAGHVEFKEIRVDEDAEIRLGLKEFTNSEIFPQLFMSDMLTESSENDNCMYAFLKKN